MSDIEGLNLTASGSGKSEAEVAFELLNKLKGQGVWGERNITAILDMYAECLDAAKGLRKYEGQNRVEAPIYVGSQKPAVQTAPAQAPVNTQPPAAAIPAAQPVAAQPVAAAQPQAIPQPQPVHAQQQAVAQAYKPAG